MWEQIRSNRFRSAVLVSLMGTVLLLLGYFLGLFFFDSGTGGLVIALAVWAMMTLVAFFQGDSILLAVAGARKINRDDHPRLYNIIEEMKISSGLEKMPDVYIIDDAALNAFATGRNPDHAAVAITSGLLQKLNRDELQGVIGHEIAHIKNRDVLLMAMSAVLLGTIVILARYASRILFFGGMPRSRRSSSRGGGGGQVIVLAVAIVLMILAPIMAQLIHFAISRRREYLADASSALYTRYPEGLASALEKLAASSTQVKQANQATAHMYTVSPFRREGVSIETLTSTHPPIQDRVRVLRAMGGASYAEYERVFRDIKGRGIIPTSAVVAPAAVQTVAHVVQTEPLEQIERARETSDVLWRLNRYLTIDCDCGARLRVPPGFKEPVLQCPHCGQIHKIEATAGAPQ
ncbi:MAG: M48 family metallopeptidase [Chloroflexi bacterium]|nr:M48 family metallopeptidase [Chloroflexota bacterium]